MPQNLEELEYMIAEPACEVNEKGTRENNDGNENTSMDDNENIELHSDESSFAEEDWNQNEMPEWIEPDKPMAKGTIRREGKKTSIRYSRYGDDFLIDKINPDGIGAHFVSMGDLV